MQKKSWVAQRVKEVSNKVEMDKKLKNLFQYKNLIIIFTQILYLLDYHAYQPHIKLLNLAQVK